MSLIHPVYLVISLIKVGVLNQESTKMSKTRSSPGLGLETGELYKAATMIIPTNLRPNQGWKEPGPPWRITHENSIFQHQRASLPKCWVVTMSVISAQHCSTYKPPHTGCKRFYTRFYKSCWFSDTYNFTVSWLHIFNCQIIASLISVKFYVKR